MLSTAQKSVAARVAPDSLIGYNRALCQFGRIFACPHQNGFYLMLEVNPQQSALKEFAERSDILRGYL